MGWPKLVNIQQSILKSEDESTGSPSNLKLGSIWLRDCLFNHSKCAFRTDALPALPYRVIDVGGEGTWQNPHRSVGRGRYGRYTTLSYRWGDITTFKTTTHNIDEYRRKISPDILPQSLQDGIYIARELGIRFLWIDALCIIQDSKPDWEQESAMMNDYYRNSLVTISVNVSKAAGAGCFMERNPLEYRPCRLKVSWTRETDMPDEFRTPRIPHSPLTRAVLACRDETLLSPWAARPPGLGPARETPFSTHSRIHDLRPAVALCLQRGLGGATDRA